MAGVSGYFLIVLWWSNVVMFTDAHATPLCSPSRVSLMTGSNAARHGVTNWTLHRDRSPDPHHPRVEPPAWAWNGLQAEAGIDRTSVATCLPQLLRDAGYVTIHCGKAHFGAHDTPGADPTTLGFEVNIAGHAAGGPGSYLGTHRWKHATLAYDCRDGCGQKTGARRSLPTLLGRLCYVS